MRSIRGGQLMPPWFHGVLVEAFGLILFPLLRVPEFERPAHNLVAFLQIASLATLLSVASGDRFSPLPAATVSLHTRADR